MDPTKVQIQLDQITRLTEQRDFDLKVLGLWAHAEKETGHDDETIRAFTFRKEHLTHEEQRANTAANRLRQPPVFCDKNWHNALRLRDESVVSMPGIKRPTPPAQTPTTVSQVIGVGY